MRKVYCYLCEQRLWGVKPNPDITGFTMGHCFNHGWVPDHEGLQVISYSWYDWLLDRFVGFIEKLCSFFGLIVYIFIKIRGIGTKEKL